ncbi:hypothetical protein KCU89_g5696, partial [Aureobasidium melanogenum]
MKWRSMFNRDNDGATRMIDEASALLPSHTEHIPSAVPAKEVTKIALRLKHQIEQVIPCELEEDRITAAHSNVITPAVVETARSAGKHGRSASSDKDYSACVVF